MRVTKFMSCIGIVFIFVLGIMLAGQSVPGSSAAEVKLVNISSTGDSTNPTGLAVDPAELTVKKGAVIVWTNAATVARVKVVFEEGKACNDVLINPRRDFELDQQSCFVTTYMPFGATSSLIFPEVGEFEYTVETPGKKLQTKGTIMVAE